MFDKKYATDFKKKLTDYIQIKLNNTIVKLSNITDNI